MSGQTVVFQTAGRGCAATGFEQVDLAPVEVKFRDLTGKSNATCAPNSPTTARAAPRAKAWVSPLDAIHSDDHGAHRLPLIRTCRMPRAGRLA